MKIRPSTMGALALALCLLQGAVHAQNADWRELVEQLASGSNQEVEQARDELITVVKEGDPVLWQRLARELADADLMSSDNTLVRINTVLVARELPEGRGLPILLVGLEDRVDGVRYLAAKSIAMLAIQDDRANVDWQAVTKAAAARGQVEENELIQRFLLQGLSSIAEPEARLAAADLLIRRGAEHARDADLALQVEAETFKRLLQAIYDKVQEGKPPRELMVKSATAGMLYMRVAADHLAAGGLEQGTQQQQENIFKSGQAVLRYVLKQLEPDQPLAGVIEGDNWERNRERVGDLVEAVTQPPFNLPKELIAGE